MAASQETATDSLQAGLRVSPRTGQDLNPEAGMTAPLTDTISLLTKTDQMRVMAGKVALAPDLSHLTTNPALAHQVTNPEAGRKKDQVSHTALKAEA